MGHIIAAAAATAPVCFQRGNRMKVEGGLLNADRCSLIGG